MVVAPAAMHCHLIADVGGEKYGGGGVWQSGVNANIRAQHDSPAAGTRCRAHRDDARGRSNRDARRIRRRRGRNEMRSVAWCGPSS